jgi:hypothetical protein
MDHSETLYEHAGGDGPIHHPEELFYGICSEGKRAERAMIHH